MIFSPVYSSGCIPKVTCKWNDIDLDSRCFYDITSSHERVPLSLHIVHPDSTCNKNKESYSAVDYTKSSSLLVLKELLEEWRVRLQILSYELKNVKSARRATYCAPSRHTHTHTSYYNIATWVLLYFIY